MASETTYALISVLNENVIAKLCSDLASHLASSPLDEGTSADQDYYETAIALFFAGKSSSGKKTNVAKTPVKTPAKPPSKAPAKVKPVPANDEVVVVLNYGPKSHALFGATQAIKDKLMALNPGQGEKGKKLVGYGKNLFFGPGWVVMDKERIGEVTDMFTAEGIAFREVERGEYEKETGVGGATNSETKEEEPKPIKAEPAKPSSVKAAPLKSVTSGLKAKKNSWGNFEEENTGIVFLDLPVGVAGRLTKVAVGFQNSDADSSETGLSSVLPLTEEMVQQCEENKWRVLSDEIMGALEKKNKSLCSELTEMRSRGSADE